MRMTQAEMKARIVELDWRIETHKDPCWSSRMKVEREQLIIELKEVEERSKNRN